jgi:hypothetical protein
VSNKHRLPKWDRNLERMDMKPITDTDRLDWLIAHGRTPAKWRPYKRGDRTPVQSQTFLAHGTRLEIDEAMRGAKDQEL